MGEQRGFIELTNTFDEFRASKNTLNREVFGSVQTVTVDSVVTLAQGTAVYQDDGSGNIVKGNLKDSVSASTTLIIQDLEIISAAKSLHVKFQAGTISTDSTGSGGTDRTITTADSVLSLRSMDSTTKFTVTGSVVVGDSADLFTSVETVIQNAIFGISMNGGATIGTSDSVGVITLQQAGGISLSYDSATHTVTIDDGGGGGGTTITVHGKDTSAVNSTVVDELTFDSTVFRVTQVGGLDHLKIDLDSSIDLVDFLNKDSVDAYPTIKYAKVCVIEGYDSAFSSVARSGSSAFGLGTQQLNFDSSFEILVTSGGGPGSADSLTFSIATNAIDSTNIKANSIGASHIKNNAIGASELDSTTITGHSATTNVDSTDVLIIYSDSANDLRKVTFGNIISAGLFATMNNWILVADSVDSVNFTVTNGDSVVITGDSTITTFLDSTNRLIIKNRIATTAVNGVSRFTSTDFTLTAGGVVSIKNGAITSVMLKGTSSSTDSSVITGLALHTVDSTLGNDELMIFDVSSPTTGLKKITVDQLRQGIGSVAWIRQEEPSGTDGDALTGLAWNNRTLNTKQFDDDSVVSFTDSTDSSKFVLNAGTYDIEAWVPLKRSSPSGGVRGMHRLMNFTDSTVIFYGSTQVPSDSDASDNMYGQLAGRFTITSSKTLRIQTYTTTSSSNGGMALSLGGITEVYTTVKITKVK